MRFAHTGKVLSEKTKEKIRVNRVGKGTGHRSEETRKRVSNALKGKPKTEAHIEALKLAHKKRWENKRKEQANANSCN